MEAIKQTVKVKNNKLNIKLPNNFNSEKVDELFYKKMTILL